MERTRKRNRRSILMMEEGISQRIKGNRRLGDRRTKMRRTRRNTEDSQKEERR
jgi:hypothetical protein